MNHSLFEAMQLRRPTVEHKVVVKDTMQSRRNEKSMTPLSETPPETPVKRIYRKYSQRHLASGQLIEVDKTVFESYFRKNKPFLNPYLTINDLIEPLHSNRTYLSKFINRTYRMNFNTYINTCRLHEMDKLLAMPGNRHKTPASLYSQAGFRSYRNYLNAKNSIKKLKSQ
jgi:AraC-like DNA-binding protein